METQNHETRSVGARNNTGVPKKDRAQIARENGAKSKGPVTPEGKARSSRNALKTGEYATKIEGFLPPHPAVLCNEDRSEFRHIVDHLLHVYMPVNEVARSIVQAIAIAHWEIHRLRACMTMHWNLTLVDQAGKPCPTVPELVEMHAMVQASTRLYAADGPIRHLNRQIDQLEFRIARLERRLKFVHANFPNSGERTQPSTTEPVENKELTPAEPQPAGQIEPSVYVTENTPAVINAYRTQFPGRRIVILPPDDVAKGIDIEDDMPAAPRRVV